MPTIEINRAPVMTLWAAVVAERLGFDRDEALTLGKTVAGLNAQSKGQRLGIYERSEPDEQGKKASEQARSRPKDEQFYVELLGRSVPAVNTPEGVRATAKGDPVKPAAVQRYLESKFGESLPEMRAAMEELAAARTPVELEGRAYRLYEQFRPEIPSGAKGWGAKGKLDTDRIRALAKQD
jgi:hypothetical protein